MQIDVRKVNWFSTYHVHHRVAERFREGRAFLLGDAAHIHSPVGGQGMNTGIGDAANLAWKLAAAVANKNAERLLDTYHTERIAFAYRLVATTDRVFVVATKSGPIARRVRVNIIPLIIPPLFRFTRTRRFMFRAVSQTGINYRASALSVGKAGRVHGGDRLPWIEPANGQEDNFVALESLKWQAHVYGTAADPIQRLCRDRELTLCQFPWSTRARHAGLERDAVYVVRPDGYVGLATKSGRELHKYLDDWASNFHE
jgi:hypothetical protein